MNIKVRFQKQGQPMLLRTSVKVGPTPDSWGRIIIDAMAAFAAVMAVGVFYFAVNG